MASFGRVKNPGAIPTRIIPTASSSQPSFHRWSKNEPMSVRHREHWSKLRCKYYRLVTLATGNYAYCDPNMEGTTKRYGPPKVTTTSMGTLAPVGNPEFNKYLKNKLQTTSFSVRRKPPAKTVPSIYHRHAKLGFKYWCEPDYEPPKAANKVIMGAKGTFFGLGVPSA